MSCKEDWEVLIKLYGGYENAGKKLKSIDGWAQKGNGILNNDKGIACLPGGLRNPSGSFSSIKYKSLWWLYPSLDEIPTAIKVQQIELAYEADHLRVSTGESGAYIRLLKD